MGGGAGINASRALTDSLPPAANIPEIVDGGGGSREGEEAEGGRMEGNGREGRREEERYR